MFSSQALETAIGLALMMFIIATAASTVLELVRRMLNSRARDLERALQSLFAPKAKKLSVAKGVFVNLPRTKLTGDAEMLWLKFYNSSPYRGAMVARGQVRPAYLSAKAFAEAVEEAVDVKGDVSKVRGALGTRLRRFDETVRKDALSIRAGLEGWYDEIMAGVSARYRKRSALIVFFLGFVLAFGANASFPHVARDLWVDQATRTAVVASAQSVAAQPLPSGAATPTVQYTVDQVVKATSGLPSFDIPVGWKGGQGGWRSWSYEAWGFHGLGWLMTAVLAGLGGPFWFDLLGRFVAIRSPKPPTATDDEDSATSAVRATLPTPPVAAVPVVPVVPASPVRSRGLLHRTRLI